MVNVKKKGNAGENRFANWLNDHGIKAWKDPSSGAGSREKGDIGNNLDMTIEVKTTKKIEIPKWWKQISHSAAMHRNQPVLVIRQDGMPKDEWLVVMHSDDWVEFIQGEHKQEDVNLNSREITYLVERIRTDLRKLNKLTEHG